MIKAACVDVTGSSRRMDLVWINDEHLVSHGRIDGEGELRGWVDEHRPPVLAIDAPSGKNLGRTRESTVRDQLGWTDKLSKVRA
jgi:hypothetical protein